MANWWCQFTQSFLVETSRSKWNYLLVATLRRDSLYSWLPEWQTQKENLTHSNVLTLQVSRDGTEAKDEKNNETNRFQGESLNSARVIRGGKKEEPSWTENINNCYVNVEKHV